MRIFTIEVIAEVQNGMRNDRGPRSSGYIPFDGGPSPYVVPIRSEALRNDNFRATVWTGENLQATVMSIPPGSDVGLELHPDVDQFFYILLGRGNVMMGEAMDNLTFESPLIAGDAVFVPAGTWHNVVNIGRTPLKFLTIYAPPEHPPGTVHTTKAEAEEAEGAR